MGVLIPFPTRPGFEPDLPKGPMARSLGVSTRTLERWVAEGCPHTRTENGHLRFRPSSVSQWRSERIGEQDGAA